MSVRILDARPVWLACTAATSAAMACAVGLAGDDRTDAEFTQQAAQVWHQRRQAIKTVFCSANVNSIFPKGCLDNQPEARAAAVDRAKTSAPNPPEDKIFEAEPCAWAIDFQANRVRKERKLATIRVNESRSPPKLDIVSNETLALFSDGMYSVFRPIAPHPTRDEKLGAFDPDVTLYKRASHNFVFDFDDLPLLWLAGGISGKLPSPDRLEKTLTTDFAYRGDAELNRHQCAIMTTPEQQMADVVREFWVGREKEFPIYMCRTRSGSTVYWQIDVDYANNGDVSAPSRWTYAEYMFGKLSYTRTYSVTKMAINDTLPAELFEKSLEPGMTVFDAEQTRDLEVNDDGSLVPWAPGSRSRRSVTRWVWPTAGAVALCVLLMAIWKYRHRPVGDN